MGAEPFQPALDRMRLGEWGVFGPTSFRSYLKENGLPEVDTAPLISVNAIEKLAPALRKAGVMVLRLGAVKSGRGTQFALVSTPNRLGDFFLNDGELFTSARSTFLPAVPLRTLFAYFVLPVLKETSAVSLAFASGLIGHALGLDLLYPTNAPATGSSTYSFGFRAYGPDGPVLEHHKGQVEVDAAFVGSRQGRAALFILECKTGDTVRSLAKHKLVYPVLALAGRLPADMPVVPVYVRVHITGREVRYHVVECAYPDPRAGLTCLTDLQPVAHRFLVLPIPVL